MRLLRHVSVPSWNSETADLAVRYLRSRGYADARVSDHPYGPVVDGTRGSLLGNLISFDMTKLRAKIKVLLHSPGSVTVDLDVDTTGQQITQWNVATWRIEIAELHSILRGGGLLDDVWRRFRKDYRAANLRWTFTFMLGGQGLSDAWENELSSLEAMPSEGAG